MTLNQFLKKIDGRIFFVHIYYNVQIFIEDFQLT
jgi:hypothetical protein